MMMMIESQQAVVAAGWVTMEIMGAAPGKLLASLSLIHVKKLSVNGVPVFVRFSSTNELYKEDFLLLVMSFSFLRHIHR